MEHYDYLMQFMLENTPVKDEEFDKVRWSLIQAAQDKQYYMLYKNRDNYAELCGFLTWEIRPSLDFKDKIDLGITNLVIAKRCRGTYPLIKATNHLRRLYPNIDKFVWRSRKKNKMFEAQQKDEKCLSIL
jgi:hypothetical protein